MKKIILMKHLFALIFSFVITTFSVVKAQNATVYGPGCVGAALSTHLTIQDAVNAASPGDCIVVIAGTYNESVSVNKSLTIKGANAGTAGNGIRVPESIVDGNNGTLTGFYITANNVTIDGFMVQNCGGAGGESGIYTNASGTLITNNILFNNEKGVYPSNTGASTVSYNLFDGNNRPGPAGGMGLYSFTTNSLSVLNNEFRNHTTNSAANFDGGTGHLNLIFNNNYLHDNDPGSSCVYAAAITVGEFAYNHINNGKRGFKIAGSNSDISIHNNIITGTVQADIMVNIDFGGNSGIEAHENSLTSAVSILNEDITVVDATCNWYGSATGPTHASNPGGTGGVVSDNVGFVQWITNGIDNDLVTPGFQPVPGSCNGPILMTTCPPDVTVQCASEVPDPDFESVTVSGGCPPVTVTWEGDVTTPGGCPNRFTITRTYKAVDACSNESTCTQLITVNDHTAPVLTIPPDATVECNAIPAPGLASATDNCGGSPTVTFLGTFGTPGPINMAFNSTSANGNQNYGERLGLHFMVNSPVAMRELGAYDDGQDGLKLPITVGIVRYSDGATVVPPIVMSGTTDPLDGYYRVRTVPSFVLAPGEYVLVAVGYGDQERNGNATVSGPSAIFNDGGGLLTSLSSPYGGVGFGNPTTAFAAPNTFHAGTFKYFSIIQPSCPVLNYQTRTWRAMDECGNATVKSQTLRIEDNTAPVLTVPGDITLECSDPLPKKPVHVNSSPNSLDGTYNFGAAFFGPALTSTPVTGDAILVDDGVGNTANACEPITNDLTGKIAVIDRGGCAAPAVLFTSKVLNAQNKGAIAVIIVNSQPGDVVNPMGGSDPLVTIPSVMVSNNYGTALKASMAMGTVNVSLSASPLTVTDCTASVITHSQVITPGDCPNNYTIVNTWTATDFCGNSTTEMQTITVEDNTAPTFTVPADITIPFTSTCGFNSAPANTESPTGVSDNCGGPVIESFFDVFVQCGNDLVITRTWKEMDGCGNFSTQDQTITVSDNNTDYVVYASKEAKFGENNTFNGSVGVTAANGKAEFKKNSSLVLPHFAKAKTVTVQMPNNINAISGAPASGGPNPPFFAYGGGGLSGNHTQNVNGVVPAGNFKHLTIKKGVTAIVNGSNYGKVTIEENATATFTSGSIDMEDLNVKKGKDPNTTNVIFTQCTGVRIKDKVDIEENSRVNVSGGQKVIFYMGDKEFSVKGDNVVVEANVNAPNGKLKIHGGNGPVTMSGWYVVEKVDADAKNVTWNHNTACGQLRGPLLTTTASKNEPVVVLPDAFKVNVFPNPTYTDFRLQVNSPSDEPVSVRIIDVSGRTLKQISSVKANTLVTIGTELRGGTYFAEVQQGTNRQTVKLLKME